MVRIGLLSDTHSFLDEKIFTHFEEVDEIWHAGDIGTQEVADRLNGFRPLWAVYGNIDPRELQHRFPLDMRREVGGVDVWMTHIGGYPGRYQARIRNGLRQRPPDLFISGHSHILKIMRDKKHGLLHINPGACGHHGFHHMRTLVRFSLQGGKIEQLEVIELGKRGR